MNDSNQSYSQQNQASDYEDGEIVDLPEQTPQGFTPA